MPARNLLCLLVVAMTFGLSSFAAAGPYTDSAHGNSTTGVDRSSIDLKYDVFAKGNCSHCHEQHSSLGGNEPLPAGSAQNPSLRFAAEENLCGTCHDGSPATKNIAIEFLKQYRHPVTDYADRHTLSIDEKGQDGLPFRGLNRHAECSDCHEPHTVQGDTHETSVGIPRTATSNAVSGVLLGAWGVEPNTDPDWLPPLGFSEVSPATKEYQICFKCHSYYALQAATGIANFTGPSGVLITDQAMEFSKANGAVHPVRMTLNDQTGSSFPRALESSRMKAPWNLNMGTQTMYCSDCHGNNSSSPAGPHASTNQFMLEGSWTWPFKPAGGKLWTLADINNNLNSWSTKLLCAKCHTLNNYGMGHSHPHQKIGHSSGYKAVVGTLLPYSDYDTSFACVACHTPVPHGSSFGRLIGSDSLLEPYTITVAPGITFPVIRDFTKGMNQKTSCFIPNTASCHTAHLR